MKELEKAKELVDKFKPLVRTPRFGKRHADPYYLAKEAAIICCDEILNELVPSDFRGQATYMNQKMYWQSVKTEIQNL